MPDRNFHLDFSTASKVEHYLLDQQFVQVGRKIFTPGRKAYGHRSRCLVGVVQIVPLVGELLAEAKGAVRAEYRLERLEHLLAVGKTVEGRVFKRDQHIGNCIAIEHIGCFRHAELPGRIDTHALERQEQIRLCIEFKESGGVAWGTESRYLWVMLNGDGLKDITPITVRDFPRELRVARIPCVGGMSAMTETRTRLMRRR
jgi:hypothetical protein